jgi:putative nucleotidyltransferase with HDIG domain
LTRRLARAVGKKAIVGSRHDDGRAGPGAGGGGVERLRREFDRIADTELRTKVAATWDAAIASSTCTEPLDQLPFDLRAPDEPLVDHICQVVEAALALAPIAEAALGKRLDRDILLAACLLHDVDKVIVFEPDERGWFRRSATGRRMGHGVAGAILCREHGLPDDVVHLVLTHTVTSAIPPEPPEGVVLHYADLFAADVALHGAGAQLFMNR